MPKLNLKPVQGEMRTSFEPGGVKKQKKILPRITLMGKDIPEMENWDVGKKYTIALEVEMVGIRKGSEYEFESSDDNKTRGTFKIHAAGEVDNDESSEENYARMRSGAARA